MIGTASTENQTFESAETLAHDVAEWLCGLALACDGAFAVCLSGGSTPRPLYERLADPAIANPSVSVAQGSTAFTRVFLGPSSADKLYAIASNYPASSCFGRCHSG